MLDKQLILGVYDDGDKLLSAVGKLRKKGVEIFDCYTPYPVHNLDVEMGIKRSNLTVGAFLCGLTGFLSGLLLQFYMMTNHLHSFKSWPMIIGGKPQDYLMMPSMVPVTFEATILFTAFGIGILFFARSKMIHGKIADVFDPRQTDDRLFIAVEPSTLSSVSRTELDSMLNESGAIEIRERNMEGGAKVQPVKKAAPKSKETVAPAVEMSSEERSSRMSSLLSVVGTASADQKNDLKKINGVGPVYEGKLNELGIYTFEQVSKLTPAAILAIEELTKYFPGKIDREDWMGQAQKLMKD
ncbi:MAG: putative flap endonuclease-1-like 5' DNA nuclease [Bacteroidia bacterium]|jgi:predicted flap endonuclease-1-like 5' DNA nuclease